MEQPPNPERWDDETLIDYELQAASAEDREISDAGARVIASQIDSPATPAIHTFVTTGQILGDQFFDQLHANMIEAQTLDQREQMDRIEQLARYAATREDQDAVPQWSELWLQQPEGIVDDWAEHDDDRCEACGSNAAEPHANGCILDPEQFEG